VVEKLLPNDVDSDSEADSESGEDPAVYFDEEPIIAYLNDPDCNNSVYNGDGWVLNENINFDYPWCCDNLNSPIDLSPLHMPLPMSMAYMHVEENDRSVFVVPSSTKDQLPIIFGKLWHWITTSNDSDEDLEPRNSFTMHDRRTIWWKKWDSTYIVVKAWILERDDTSLYSLSY